MNNEDETLINTNTKTKKLSVRHELFCTYLFAGDSQTEAYQKAYGIRQKNSAIAKSASRLASKAEIVERLEEMRERMRKQVHEELLATALWTRDKAVEVLMKIIEEGNPVSTLNAVKQLNSMYGFNTAEVQENEQDEANSIEVRLVPIKSSKSNAVNSKDKLNE